MVAMQMEPHQLQTVSCHQLVQLKAFVPPLPRCLQNWWCCIVPVSWGKLLSSPYSGCLSPANVTTEVKCVEMHHEALSEAIPEGAVHQNVYSGNCCQLRGGGGYELWLEAAILHCSWLSWTIQAKSLQALPLYWTLQVCWREDDSTFWTKLVQQPSVRSPAILCVLRRFSNSAPKRWRG